MYPEQPVTGGFYEDIKLPVREGERIIGMKDTQRVFIMIEFKKKIKEDSITM